MMEPHKLVNFEDRKCPYCQSDCDLWSDTAGSTYPNYYIDILSCPSCNETFEIFWWGDQCHKIDKFTYSCNRIYVLYDYEKNKIYIGDKDLSWRSNQSIDGKFNIEAFFITSFSDKEKLYNKLKIYLTFS